MGSMGSFRSDDLKKLRERLDRFDGNSDALAAACARDLAAYLLSKVDEVTPVGDYPKSTGKKGGTLRRGWTANQDYGSGGRPPTPEELQAYVDTLQVRRSGGTYVIEIVNPVEYASYVEYGHRKRNGEWTEGRFMLTRSEQVVQGMAPKLLERRIKKYLEEYLK